MLAAGWTFRFYGNYECWVKAVQLTDEDGDNKEMEIIQGRVHTIGIYLDGCRPEGKDMERIGSILQPMYDLISSNRIENRTLAALRDTILPQLMSGELDVSDLT